MFVGNVALVNGSSSAIYAVAGGLQRSYGFKYVEHILNWMNVM